MSFSSQRPQRARAAGRSSRRLGVNASCLLLTILAANHAAARSDTSLPYLVQAAPEPLRIAARRVLGPPPVRPGSTVEKPAGSEPVAAPAAAAGHAVPGTVNGAPDDSPAHASPPAAPAEPPAPSAPAGAPLVPDLYAPPPAPVTIDQLLPFFIPPSAPPSRATYELK